MYVKPGQGQIPMVGLFGLMSYAVAQRTQEIGIRMALGAHKIKILGSVLGESLLVVCISLVLGLGLAFKVPFN